MNLNMPLPFTFPDWALPVGKPFPEVPIVPRTCFDVLQHGDPAALSRQRHQAWLAACARAGGFVPYPHDTEFAMAYVRRLTDGGGDFHGVVAFTPERVLEAMFAMADHMRAAAQPAPAEGEDQGSESVGQEPAGQGDSLPVEGGGTNEARNVNSVWPEPVAEVQP